jgi:hypothetical protein
MGIRKRRIHVFTFIPRLLFSFLYRVCPTQLDYCALVVDFVVLALIDLYYAHMCLLYSVKKLIN